MLQSLELLPDESGTDLVRREWQLLRDEGLPSLLDHRGATNAPHVTAVAVPALVEEARDLATDLMGALLPVECSLTGLVVLGQRRLVLARLVEVPDVLVDAVLRVKAATTGHPFPGWLPHVTLSHGLDRAAVARATSLLETSQVPFVLTSLRWWNPETGVVVTLSE